MFSIKRFSIVFLVAAFLQALVADVTVPINEVISQIAKQDYDKAIQLCNGMLSKCSFLADRHSFSFLTWCKFVHLTRRAYRAKQ